MAKFLLRFDDITPGMAWSKFIPLKKKIEEVEIKSILGVVPSCKDKNLMVEKNRKDFFQLIRDYQSYGDTIMQHGTYHNYATEEGGLLGINKFSEFAGLKLDEQLNLIEKGKKILVDEEVWEPYFIAPAHSFDKNTIKALLELGFSAISDGYGFYPYNIQGIKLIPQLISMPLPIPLGLQTIAVHINTMEDSSLSSLIKIIEANQKKFITFEEALSIHAKYNFLAVCSRIFTEKMLKVIRS